MKKMNKKLLGSLILGLMLSVPVSQVCAAELKEGAIYGEREISMPGMDPNGSDAYKKYRTGNGGYFTYDFKENSKLVVDNDSADNDGIFIRGPDSGVLGITIENQLDINIEKEGKDASLNGITIFNGYPSNPAEEQVIDLSAGGSITVTSTNAESSFSGLPDGLPAEYYPAIALYGASILSGGEGDAIHLGESDITVTANNANMNVTLQGLYMADGASNQITMESGEINITSNVTSRKPNTMQGRGMMVAGEKNTIETKNVSITVDMTGNKNTEKISNSGIAADYGGEVITHNGDITVHGKDGQAVYSYGIYSYGGKIKKTGGNIKAVAEGEGNLYTYGVLANEGSIDVGIADVASQAIGGSTVQSMALVAMGNSSISYAGGTITASADNESAYVAAVHVQNDATININNNKDTKNTVVINGDVNNNADGDGKVYLNLNTADSVLNGAVSDENGTFNLENGAQWNVLGASTVKDFQMGNGIINMATDGNVNIASYSGNGTISFLAKDVGTDGVMTVNTGNITITSAASGSAITLSAADNAIDTLDSAKAEKNLNALANKTYYDDNDGNLTGKVVIQEGLITPEARGDLLFDADDRGYVANMTRGSRMTKTMNAMKNLEAAAVIAWRQEDSTFSQRLGELRESTGGQGIWARMSRGEFEYDGEYKNQYNFFQLGYDWASDNWHYGVAVSHNDGETAYTYGSGENRSTSLSLYGTWLGDAGHYADIVLKQGRLSNDFDVYTSAGHTSGDYDAWGTSLSGEYGKKILLENDWYVTPQAQLTLMRIGGEDYDTNNGIRVRQDTLYSAVGRLGFELGRKLDEKGSVYAKASVLHDFAGNAETYLSYNGFTNSYSQDLSDTWFEAGIGFNYRTGDNSYVYADVVRTFGGDVETPWQWNLGMRWSC